MARLRSPLCESNGIAACGIWRADKRDSNPGPPGEKVLNEVPLFRTFRPYTLWRRTSTPTIRSSCAWPASAGAQRRRESEEKFTISCAEWSDLDTSGERRRAAPKASPKKILRFWSLKWSILSGFSCARGRRCQVFLFENPRFLPSFLNGCFLNGVLAL